MSHSTAWGRWHLADMFTVCNGLAGFLAIMYVMDGGMENHLFAAQLILLGMLFDGLDGIVARRLGTVHEYGIKLDAICDVITFCFAPGFLLYSVYYDPSSTSLQSVDNASVVTAVLLICGMGTLRLARSGNGEGSEWTRCFHGLPTSYAAYVSVGLVFTISDPMMASMIIGLLSILMYSRISFLRPGGRVTLVFLCFVLAMLYLLHGWMQDPNRYLLQALLLISGVYLSSPLLLNVNLGGGRD